MGNEKSFTERMLNKEEADACLRSVRRIYDTGMRLCFSYLDIAAKIDPAIDLAHRDSCAAAEGALAAFRQVENNLNIEMRRTPFHPLRYIKLSKLALERLKAILPALEADIAASAALVEAEEAIVEQLEKAAFESLEGV